MRKKNIIIIGLLLVFLSAFISILEFDSGYRIIITNSTDKAVTNLELKYAVGSTIKIISQIESKKYWKDNIDTDDIQGENAIILTYNDNNGNSYEEYLVGYLEAGYDGRVNVDINKIYDNGQLELEVELLD